MHRAWPVLAWQVRSRERAFDDDTHIASLSDPPCGSSPSWPHLEHRDSSAARLAVIDYRKRDATPISDSRNRTSELQPCRSGFPERGLHAGPAALGGDPRTDLGYENFVEISGGSGPNRGSGGADGESRPSARAGA
jgi:hypothetical protein